VLITFDANGGAGSMSQQIVPQSTSTAVSANVFTRDRYVFRGWNSAADGTGTVSVSNRGNVTSSADLTLYAMWTSLEDRAIDLPGNLNSALTGPSGVIPSGEFTAEAWIYLRNNISRTVFSEGTSASSVYLTTHSDGTF
jgi:uncharacterized repeat protein (TIGR02543 family)